MTDFTISLPEDLRTWVESHVSDGTHISAAAYVTALIRSDIDQDEDVVRLRAAIDAGRSSGIGERSLQEIWAARVAARNAA